MNLNLNYEGFESYLVEKGRYLGGIQYVFRFENNYGASVVKHRFSYGHEDDLWELAVIGFRDDGDWDIDYSTEITNDVIGLLTDERVKELLKEIKEL